MQRWSRANKLVFNYCVWVEGQEPEDLKKYEKALNMLERGNIIKCKMKYTHRSEYREYELTKKGEELAKKLQESLK